MSEKNALKVDKRKSNELIKLLRNLKLLDEDLKIKRTDDFIIVPLLRKPTAEELEKLNPVKPTLHVDIFAPRVRISSVKDALKGLIPDEMLNLVPSSMDLIGEVAIIQVQDELKPFLKMIGEAVLKIYPRIKTVLVKRCLISGV
ncbi:hypothetical protein KEJ48_02410, partial [Candidatus Bathyarchaeota archaeon]|nr:hypothetical protein [Candidatus Bathyarchaeota archaeon]